MREELGTNLSKGPEARMSLLGWNAPEDRTEVNMNGVDREVWKSEQGPARIRPILRVKKCVRG